MNLSLRTVGLGVVFTVAAAIPAVASIERTLDKTFTVAAGSAVRLDLSGAPIHVAVGPAGTARVVLKQKLPTDDAAAADRLLEDYTITCGQEGGTVELRVEKKKSLGLLWGLGRQIGFSAELTVPADVRLELDTSGGSIAIDGTREAAVRAETSGGAIKVEGGTDLVLDTSGGSIHVRRALGRLRADTSGGSITVDYVDVGATSVELDTAGGSIHVGVNPAARFDIVGDTSGGSVGVEGFTAFEIAKKERSHISGRLNGGGGRLTADTSGGSIRITAVAN